MHCYKEPMYLTGWRLDGLKTILDVVVKEKISLLLLVIKTLALISGSLLFVHFHTMSYNCTLDGGSLVSKVTVYRLNDWDSIPGTGRDFSLCHHVQTGFRVHQHHVPFFHRLFPQI